MSSRLLGTVVLPVCALCCLSFDAFASSIFLGANGAGPIQEVSTSGSPIGTVGSVDASAAALDGAGSIYVVAPGDSQSTFYVYDPAQTLLREFAFKSGIDNGDGAASYITDLAWGAGSLWASAYNGYVYRLSPTGDVLSSFDTGSPFTGIATDGVNLYTTGGMGLLAPSPFIYRRDLAGAILSSVNSGLNDTLGIGIDSSSGDFVVGGIDVVSRISSGGSILHTFASAGVNSGVEVGDIGTPPVTAVPEPATSVFVVSVLALGLLVRNRDNYGKIAAAIAAAVFGLAPASAAVSLSSLAATPSAPAPVGTTINLVASASDSDPGDLRYRFSVSRNGGPYSVVVDYASPNTFAWTPSEMEGNYSVQVSVLNRTTGSTATTSIPYDITSRVTGAAPVVSSTNNPLVALYSAPACTAGVMRVRFKMSSESYWHTTSPKPCSGTTSMNFLVAGMRANSTYMMRNDVINGPRITSSGDVPFTTGTPSASIWSVSGGRVPPTSMTEPVTVLGPIGAEPFAVDQEDQLIWYLPIPRELVRLTPGGSVLAIHGGTIDTTVTGFSEYDLAGNVLKDTTTERLNDQLATLGVPAINLVHHDVRRLQNGDYIMLGAEEVLTDVQGPLGDVLGDLIIVTDNNLQIKWVWNSFDHLDVTRKAVLGEVCGNGTGGCLVAKSTSAYDWTHGNSVALTPDGNILYSARHQDFIYKIDYENGSGDGHVMWRLGKDGDFTWISNDPYPWQSHQHEVEYETSDVISLFDNGNTRVAQQGGNSRGQVLKVDEANRTVTPLINADLGVYSSALGSATPLSSGGHEFDAGLIGGVAQTIEVGANGAILSKLDVGGWTYRTFRVRDLYSAPW